MGQSVIKRTRREYRAHAVKAMIKQMDWCMNNINIREDGVDRPITAVEAAEFIYLTSTNQLKVKKLK